MEEEVWELGYWVFYRREVVGFRNYGKGCFGSRDLEYFIGKVAGFGNLVKDDLGDSLVMIRFACESRGF